MGLEVTINGITGTSPYDLYICQPNGSGCFYISTISSTPKHKHQQIRLHKHQQTHQHQLNHLSLFYIYLQTHVILLSIQMVFTLMPLKRILYL